MSAAGDPRAAARARRVRWAVALGEPVLRVLARTWRIEERGTAGWRAERAAGRPLLFTYWHGHLLPITWARRADGMTGMVSEHADGEIISRIVRRWGWDTVRGSTSRGAGRVLLAMIRVLESGRDGALTPDGPRGPAGVAQAGAILAARRAGARIVPARIAVDRAWHGRGWDRFALPKPFARVVITYGDPWAPEGDDEAAATELARRLGAADVSAPEHP